MTFHCWVFRPCLTGIPNNGMSSNYIRYTVRPLLSAPLLPADLVYPRFLRPKLSTPKYRG